MGTSDHTSFTRRAQGVAVAAPGVPVGTGVAVGSRQERIPFDVVGCAALGPADDVAVGAPVRATLGPAGPGRPPSPSKSGPGNAPGPDWAELTPGVGGQAVREAPSPASTGMVVSRMPHALSARASASTPAAVAAYLAAPRAVGRAAAMLPLVLRLTPYRPSHRRLPRRGRPHPRLSLIHI